MWRIWRASADSKHWKLAPLTPEYRENEHGGYVKAINAALKSPKIRNIALSGNYGVGKSSILQKVAEQHKNRVVELSLSTLAPLEEAPKPKDSVPNQATTPTNRIQQEIVKQLLYCEEPHRTSGSRFRRIERFRWRRELVLACLSGLVVMVVFLLAGWTRELATEFIPLVDLGLWSHLFVLGVAASVVVTVRHLLHGRIHISQLSAGSATITLDDKSVSYFDQYLDEIVYFFEVSKRDIVIFEDIDRFNDSLIFETLRSLNTLLNASRRKNKPIRFIYAIKDSIFDQIGLVQEGRGFKQDRLEAEDPAQAEVVRANRTKFFDLVIPVVPFITHRSARNLAVQLLQEIEYKIDADLIDLASRYVPDMRLLKNVRNEFIVFRDRIFSGDGEQLDLSETELFAMMLYKSTHLSDFEVIRLGKSKLDELYKVARKLVATNVKNVEKKIRDNRQRLTYFEHIDGITARSSWLGDQFIAHVERTVRSASFNAQHGRYTFNNKEKAKDELQDAKFWGEFVRAAGEPELLWLNNRYSQKLSFTRSDLAAALNVRLEPECWNKADREELEAALVEHNENLKFLRGADMGDLIKRQDFEIEYDGSKQSLDAIARQLLTEGLAYQLVRANYINRNFTLYTSTFHGNRVSAAATNFINHHVERDLMDEHFQLKSNDVKAVIREVGKSALRESALYNIAILDHILRTDPDAADIMIRSLVRFGDDQKRFLQAYLNGGGERARFVERFAAVSPRVLVYLVSQAELDGEARLELVNVALAHLAEDIQYQTDSSVSEYLETHYAELPTLTSASLEGSVAKRAARVFSTAGIQVPALKPLSEAARQALVAQDLYVINRENLAIVIGSDTSLALDTAREMNKGAYKYVMENVGAYLSAVDGISATVASEAHFTTVIEDVLAADDSQLDEVIARASESCIVTDLADVSESAWPLLARHERFPATFSNVSGYIDSVEAVDADLAKVLATAGGITEHSTFEEGDKQQLAKRILAAREDLSSASLRAQLVASLSLQYYLDVGEIEAEKGELFALLLKHDIVEDDATTYAHLSGTDWPTREFIICASAQFKDYITPSLLQSDLAALLLSNKVSHAIKVSIADRASEYIEGSSKKDLAQLAQFATRYRRQLTLDVVEQLASNGVPAQDVVILLEPHLQTLSSDQLFGILQSFGDDYSKLTSVGRDRPTIPNTLANRALLEALKRHGIVNTYTPEDELIRVNKKHKTNHMNNIA